MFNFYSYEKKIQQEDLDNKKKIRDTKLSDERKSNCLFLNQ